MSTALVQHNRSSNIEVLMGEFRQAVESLPPELSRLTQDEIEESRKPTDVDYWLRKNLWSLFEKSEAGLVEEIWPQDIYKGVCSKQAFFQVLRNPLRVAWLMTVPHADQESAEAGLAIGMRNLIKFVSKEPTAETAGPFMKAIEFLYNRVHGPIVQRIDARHAHAHMKVPQKAESPEDVQRKLSELKTKLIGGS